MSTLYDRLRSEDMESFENAVHDLMVLPKDKAINLLEEMANESDEEYRCRAVDVLKTVCPERAILLALRFLKDSSSSVRVIAIDTLRQCEAHVGVVPVGHLLLSDPDDLVRHWAAIFLGALGDESMIPLLERCMSDEGVNHEGEPIRFTIKRAIQQVRTRAHTK